MTSAKRGLPKRALSRRAARLSAVQALYQLDMSGAPIGSVIREFREFRFGKEIEGELYPEPDEIHFEAIVRGVGHHQLEIDRLIEDALTNAWSLVRLDRTLRALLRAAVLELTQMGDVPHKVVIDEYIEVAHAFFSGDEPGLVNGLLDGIKAKLPPRD